jgi:hypothetical protein
MHLVVGNSTSTIINICFVVIKVTTFTEDAQNLNLKNQLFGHCPTLMGKMQQACFDRWLVAFIMDVT